MSLFHVGDEGNVIELDVVEAGAAVDCSTATTKEFVFRLPNGTTMTRSVGFKTNGVDGKLTYTTVAGDLSADGNWLVQVHCVTPSSAFHTRAVGFYVASNLS